MFRTCFACAIFVGAGLQTADAAIFFFDPSSSYLSTADIPAGFYAGGSPSFLEDFEAGDGLLAGGISVTSPSVAYLGLSQSSATFLSTDSVDADDGTIDGSGSTGDAFFLLPLSGSPSMTFTFSDPTLPTAAGLVWTDGLDFSVNKAHIIFEAFGPGMVSLGTIVVDSPGDFNKFNGETAEDRFFGVTDLGGIKAIKISMDKFSGIEVDHVQYGAAIPEPSSILTLTGLALCFGLAGWWRKRRRAAR